jgi:hypothetical protein
MRKRHVKTNSLELVRLNREIANLQQQIDLATGSLKGGHIESANRVAQSSLDEIKAAHAQHPPSTPAAAASKTQSVPPKLKKDIEDIQAYIKWYQEVLDHLPEGQEIVIVLSGKRKELKDLIAQGKIDEAEKVARMDYREYVKRFLKQPENKEMLDEAWQKNYERYHLTGSCASKLDDSIKNQRR